MTSITGSASIADGELARRIAARRDSAAAEAELCRRFGTRVRLYGLRHLRDRDAADELAQRVLLLTLEKLRGGAVRDPEQIGSFVLGVARTLVREGHRAGRTFVPVEDERIELPVQPAEEDHLALSALARCLQQLAERERAVVVLTYYQDAPPSEISSTLGMAGSHVRVVRHRALGRLRRCMGLEPRDPAGRERPA